MNSPSSRSRKGIPLISDTTKKSVIKERIIMFIQINLGLICSAVDLVLLFCYSKSLTVRFTELVNPMKARKIESIRHFFQQLLQNLIELCYQQLVPEINPNFTRIRPSKL